MEFDKVKFEEKKKGLLELGKKKKNILEYQEISDYFQDFPLSQEQMEEVLEFLEAEQYRCPAYECHGRAGSTDDQ